MRRPGEEPTTEEADRLFNLKLEMAELERDESLVEKDIKWLKQVIIKIIIFQFQLIKIYFIFSQRNFYTSTRQIPSWHM